MTPSARFVVVALLSCMSAVAIADFDSEMKAAVALSGAGRFNEAHAAYDRAAAFAEQQGDQVRRGRVLRERGVTFLHQGAYEDARASFDQSIAVFEGLGDVAEASKARLRLISMTASRDPATAREMLDRVFDDLESVGDEKALRSARLYKARLLTTGGEVEEGLELLGHLRTEYQALGDERRLADVLNLESWSFQELGRWEEARKAYVSLIDTAFRTGRQQLMAYAYCNLGDVERELGVHTTAEDRLDRAIELLDELRAAIPGGAEERMTYLDAQVSAYDGKIRYLVDRDDVDGAFAVAERFHGTSFLEDLHHRGSAGSPPELDDEGRDVLRELVALQSGLISDGLDQARTERLKLLEKRWELIGRVHRRRATAVAPAFERRSIDDVQGLLPPRTAMVAYWVHPERTFAWVVLPGRVVLYQIPIGRDALRGKIDEYMAPIRDRVRAEDLAMRGAIAEHLKLGAELYALLVEPARAVLDGIEHVILVPDDGLWRLSFEALVVDPDDAARAAAATAVEGAWFAEYATVRFAAHEFSTMYAPSAAVWVELAQRNRSGQGLLAVAPSLEGSDAARERGWNLKPLPAARREATAVAQIIGSGGALLGEAASEREVRRRLRDRRYVHFATHGYLHGERPSLSGLFLWPSAGEGTATAEDGLFQGFEVRDLTLKADLVSLAACNSGVGQLSRAEGLIGIARDFLIAGARNALVTMWPVDDGASSLLIERFYDGVRRRASFPAALREARLGLLDDVITDTIVEGDERVALAHPYFWATYVLLGGDRLDVPPFPVSD